MNPYDLFLQSVASMDPWDPEVVLFIVYDEMRRAGVTKKIFHALDDLQEFNDDEARAFCEFLPQAIASLQAIPPLH